MTETRILGSLWRIDEDRGGLRVEDVYDTDIDDLWNAVTSADRLARWVGEIEGDLRVGGTFHAAFRSTWNGPGRVEACDAPHRLLVTLEPDSDDRTEIEAWLTAEGEKTRLVVEERGLEVGKVHFHGAGWQAHLEDLKNYLTGCGDGDWRSRWQALTPGWEAIAPA
ncbi:MAG: SRPBCC domain-containing protein [Marmoricola sp.]